MLIPDDMELIVRRQRFCREAILWRRIKHPYVLPLIGIDNLSWKPSLCMVSPWMRNGTLFEYVEVNGTANVNKHVRILSRHCESLC
jgi:hypothetical protein